MASAPFALVVKYKAGKHVRKVMAQLPFFFENRSVYGDVHVSTNE
jgi:hypothetical protein